MTSYTADLDVRTAVATPTRCPGCDAVALQPLQDGDRLAFRCERCSARWRIEYGRALRLSPVAAPVGRR